jgi:hypothetical protein
MDAISRNKLSQVLDLFKYGNQVADPNVWANRATLISTLTMFISAAVASMSAFGHPLGMESSDIKAIVLGIVSLGTFIADRMHVASNDQAGIKPKE